MTDLLLYASLDGGEIEVTNGVLTTDEGPFQAMYLSLFGGNFEDSGDTSTDSEQWWGNYSESDETLHLRSRTQALLIGLPAIPANLVRVEEAVLADLDWMNSELAESLEVTASLPARNTIRIVVLVQGKDGQTFTFDVSRPWGPSS